MTTYFRAAWASICVSLVNARTRILGAALISLATSTTTFLWAVFRNAPVPVGRVAVGGTAGMMVAALFGWGFAALAPLDFPHKMALATFAAVFGYMGLCVAFAG